MEAKELMIGDWVRISDDDTDEYFDAQIKGVDFLDNVYAPIPGEEKPCPFSIDCVEPIPLTPEILEKNGFTYSASESNGLCRTYIYGDNSNHVLAEVTLYDLPINGCGCLIRIETDSQTCGGINKIHNCDLLYVHQLQHALRLCQIEKEITV